MNDNILKTLRAVLLLGVVALLALFAYRYFARGELSWSSLMPIFGLAIIYIITSRSGNKS